MRNLNTGMNGHKKLVKKSAHQEQNYKNLVTKFSGGIFRSKIFYTFFKVVRT